MKIHWKRLFHRGCEHSWRNTGDPYTDPKYGFTIVLKECRVCGLTIIVKV